MQVVVAMPDPESVPTGVTAPLKSYADLDIDLGGSLTDIVGFVIHMKELASSDPVTDHLDLFQRLVDDEDSPVSEFLYYDVTTDS